MWRVTVMVFLLAAAARAQFPFTDSPLEPTINSNKVFFNMTNLKDIAGVWKGINTVYPPLIEDPDLYDGVFNMTCDYSLGGGWNYDFFISFPLSITIEVDENSLEEGIIGNYIEAGVFWVPEAGEFRPQTRRFGIRDFSTSDGLAALDIDACRMWRPYFDWEVGKTMLLRKYRYFFFPDENGQSQFNELEGCINSDDEHPMCTEGDFEIDGGSHTGVIIDTPMWMECIAGPCLDLPFTLDGYVQTQGYIPAWVNSDGK